METPIFDSRNKKSKTFYIQICYHVKSTHLRSNWSIEVISRSNQFFNNNSLQKQFRRRC